MSYSKPKVTIDLEEYQELLKIKEKKEKYPVNEELANLNTQLAIIRRENDILGEAIAEALIGYQQSSAWLTRILDKYRYTGRIHKVEGQGIEQDKSIFKLVFNGGLQQDKG